MNINKLLFNKETSQQVVPIGYKDFTFSGKDIVYSDHQNITIGSVALKPANGEIRDVILTPGDLSGKKTTMELKTNHIAFNINKLDFVDKKLVLDFKDVLIENANGTIKAGEHKAVKKPGPGIIQSVIIRKVS